LYLTVSKRDHHLDERAVHVAVDMQRLFAEPGPWQVPWLERVVVPIARLAERFPERTIFTRFIPPQLPEDMPGAWHDYYRHWRAMTQEKLPPELLELVGPLKRLVPPATLCDKATYSAFGNKALRAWLAERRIGTLLVSGGETDVCVLATVMQAVDLGFHVLLVSDALCSVSNTSHDAMLSLFARRFSQQVGTITVEETLLSWRPVSR
jgi:nicotinamidase-related amidase